MGLIDKIYKVARTTDHITNIANKVDVKSLVGGIDLKNINVNNLDGIKNSIESSINGVVGNMTSEIENSVNIGDIESIANSINISDLDLNIPGIEGLEGLNFM